MADRPLSDCARRRLCRCGSYVQQTRNPKAIRRDSRVRCAPFRRLSAVAIAGDRSDGAAHLRARSNDDARYGTALRIVSAGLRRATGGAAVYRHWPELVTDDSTRDSRFRANNFGPDDDQPATDRHSAWAGDAVAAWFDRADTY